MISRLIYLSPRLFIIAVFFTVFNCSNDDDGSSDDPESTCLATGEIQSNLVDDWTGRITFNTTSASSDVFVELDADGTFLSGGESTETVSGCWRVSENNINLAGSYTENNNTVLVNFQGNIVTQDSIYGSHTSSIGESGELWFVR